MEQINKELNEHLVTLNLAEEKVQVIANQYLFFVDEQKVIQADNESLKEKLNRHVNEINESVKLGVELTVFQAAVENIMKEIKHKDETNDWTNIIAAIQDKFNTIQSNDLRLSNTLHDLLKYIQSNEKNDDQGISECLDKFILLKEEKSRLDEETLQK